MQVVKVAMVPSSGTGHTADQHQFLSTYLLNDCVVIDAGCLGYVGTPQEQAAIKHVLLTHSHIDHVGSLPVFLENAFEGKRDCVTVHATHTGEADASRTVLDDKQHIQRSQPHRLDTEEIAGHDPPGLAAQQ